MRGALSNYHAALSLDIWLMGELLNQHVLNKELWGKKEV